MSIVVFLLTLGDILFTINIAFFIFLSYMILFIGIFILFVVHVKPKKKSTHDIGSFHQTLYGRLFHFQCPVCQGIFAVKESMYTENGTTIITCPDCGHLGRIKAFPPKKIALVPERKSKNVVFRCLYCGQSLRIWAEGVELHPRLQVFMCPYCGKEKKLKKC